MKRILVVGDSWNAGRDDVSGKDDSGWARLMDPEKYETVNLAVSGSLASDWALGAMENRLLKAVQTPCDVAVVSLGGNDARRALGDGTVTVEERETARAALAVVCLYLMMAHPDWPDARQRVLVLLYANPFPGNAASEAAVAELNREIREACKMGVEFVDTSAFLGEGDFYEGAFDPARIHPNRSGYGKIAAAVAEAVEK